ncbi:AN1-type zinc finger protein 1 isoform X2 [Syngnathus acus]|uniref:AN1-type zinc finger protein 1 isoform X2 n=1 Tax=Syngnathus acus TaxID=161584 RepID=UPI001885D073|nr:AN1-type zinc finger protein 1 isoform X2 [Syngnathus acus]
MSLSCFQLNFNSGVKFMLTFLLEKLTAKLMAELDIGKHCRIDSCHQQDFLPFVCDSCNGVYCLEHRSREAHSCSQEPARREPQTAGGSTSYPCSVEDCKGKELLPVVCPQCQKHFCLAHRHQDDHKCEKLEVQKPRMAATKELVQRIVESKDGSKSKGRKGAKNSATAAKVALMKLKLHAAGDKSLPQTERIYFQVYLPKGYQAASQPMFFCSKWSVGKVVDYAASLASLKNNNNVLVAQKLRLCHPETGKCLRMDDSLHTLLSSPEDPLHNGGNVILEYLDNKSTGVEDVSNYVKFK